MEVGTSVVVVAFSHEWEKTTDAGEAEPILSLIDPMVLLVQNNLYNPRITIIVFIIVTQVELLILALLIT